MVLNRISHVMDIPVFVINLDRSPHRWAILQENATALGIELRRVTGVDGASVDRSDWADVDAASFARRQGRTILPGEYGCYRSHLKALEMARDCGMPFAMIIEDDVAFDRQTMPRVEAVIRSVPRFDLIKLVNHRVRWFVPKGRTAAGDVVGRAVHGPLGSSAAYLVSKDGAGRLRAALATMTLPLDIALERHWANGAAFYVAKDDVVGFAPNRGSTVLQTTGYDAAKFPFWQRIPTAFFRLGEYVNRAVGAILLR